MESSRSCETLNRRAACAAAGFIAAIVIAIAAAPALAQDYPPVMPDTGGYSPGNAAAQSGMPALTPQADPGGDGSSVTVPIPGGGSVTADGPAPEATATQTSNELWSTQMQNPNSIGGVPIGPQ
ncbi:MAG: hypothetical protein ACYDC3_06250 [Candidatus Binataceae bacterium]